MVSRGELLKIFLCFVLFGFESLSSNWIGAFLFSRMEIFKGSVLVKKYDLENVRTIF